MEDPPSPPNSRMSSIGLFSNKRPDRISLYHQRQRRHHIVAQISECVKIVLHEFAGAESALPSCQSTDELCTALEAMLIHGLRDTFLERMSSAINTNRRPQPNFWPALMLFTHSATLEHIGKLSQIHTDIGKCRAWLRTTLNDGLLTSYLNALPTVDKSLQLHYERYALMRSSDQLEMVERHLIGLEAHAFKLAANSSLLNSWPAAPLVLAGLESEEPMSRVIMPGIDAAAMIAEATPLVRDRRSRSSSGESRRSRLGRSPSLILNALDPDQVFDLIMKSRPAAGTLGGSSSASSSGRSCGVEARVDGAAGGGAAAACTPAVDLQLSFISVLESYRENSPRARSLLQTPDLARVFQHTGSNKSTASSTASTGSVADDAVSIASSTASKSSSAPTAAAAASSGQPTRRASSPQQSEGGAADDSNPLPLMNPPAEDPPAPTPPARAGPPMPPLHELTHQGGLDLQRYTCAGCPRFIGMLYGQPRLCALDSLYYCRECHTDTILTVIPARVLHNWDFREYPVSHRSARRLRNSLRRDKYNLSDFNPSAYQFSANACHVKNLRQQVYFLYAFLKTCRAGKSALSLLHQRLGGLMYFAKHMHTYTIVDLQDLRMGQLGERLERVVREARAHVLCCEVCSQKGFICEMCGDDTIIYPFEVLDTHCCKTCGAVFHQKCWKVEEGECPRCQRRQKRDLEKDEVATEEEDGKEEAVVEEEEGKTEE